MDKLTRFGKKVVENYYRLLSIAHVTHKVTVPSAQKAFELINEKVKLEENDSDPVVVNYVKRNIRGKIALGQDLTMKHLETIGTYLDDSVLEVENRLKQQYGIDTNQWLFSKENIETMEKIIDLLDLTFKEVQHINRFDLMRYLAAWMMLQGLYMTSYNKRMINKSTLLDFPRNDPNYIELKRIHEECRYYSIYAGATYGKFFNPAYSEEKEISSIDKYTNLTEEFIFHTKLRDIDVLHTFWETTPYKPAYVIARDEHKKTITLCVRGTDHWADAVTDLDFHYLSFSIVKEPNKDQLFLRFHYNEEYQEYLKKRLGDDTRDLNGEVTQPPTGNEIVIETGYAHAGMLVSAIGAYKEITPKLEDILSKPENSEYNLAITGHSLGGGMATLMTLLYMIHPIKALRDRVKQKLRGYSYGGASVLSLDFDKYMKEMMKSVVLGYDVVPRLSYGSIKDLCKNILVFQEINGRDPNVISEVLSIETHLGDFIKLLSKEKSDISKFTGLYEEFKKVHMDSLKLYPMGRVFHIQDFSSEPIKRQNKSFEFVMREVNKKEYFDEIIFSKDLIKHHFSDSYEGALASNKVLYQKHSRKAINKQSQPQTQMK